MLGYTTIRDASTHNIGFDLRGFSEPSPGSNTPDIQTVQKTYINQLCDPRMGI